MYQYDFICTYKLIDEEYANDLYMSQILQAFDISSWDDDSVNNTIMEIFNKFNNNNNFKKIINKALLLSDFNDLYDIICMINDNNSDDNNDIKKEENKERIFFSFLFNYNFFDLLHKCICELFIKGDISNTTLDTILNKL
jgi:hypothetical protein